MKGKSNFDGRSKRAAGGGSAAPKVTVNGSLRRQGETKVVLHGVSSVNTRQDIARISPYLVKVSFTLRWQAFHPEDEMLFCYIRPV